MVKCENFVSMDLSSFFTSHSINRCLLYYQYSVGQRCFPKHVLTALKSRVKRSNFQQSSCTCWCVTFFFCYTTNNYACYTYWNSVWVIGCSCLSNSSHWYWSINWSVTLKGKIFFKTLQNYTRYNTHLQ